MTMGTWKSKKFRQKGKASQTPGKQKGERCTTSPEKKYFACSPKAYKHPQYERWNALFRRYNHGGSSTPSGK